MQLKFLALASVALSASHVQAAVQAKAVVKSFADITEVSDKTNAILKDLTTTTETTQVVPKAVENIKDIIIAILKELSLLNDANTNFGPRDQSDICTAFHGFSTVHQDLLNTLIGKQTVLSSTPFPTLLSAILHILGVAVDNLANGIISLVPTCASEAKSDLKALDGILSTAVDLVGSVADTVVGGVGGAGGRPSGARRATSMRDTANKIVPADSTTAKEKTTENVPAEGMKKVVNKMSQADGTTVKETTTEKVPAEGMKKVFSRMMQAEGMTMKEKVTEKTPAEDTKKVVKEMAQADGTTVKEKMTEGMTPAQGMRQTANRMSTKNM